MSFIRRAMAGGADEEGEMPDPVDERRNERRRALARELRAIAEVLSVADPDDEALEESTALARSMLRRLGSARRPRWYDRDASGAEQPGGSRRAYQDQSPVRGEINPIAPPLRLWVGERSDGTPVIVGQARLGMAYEGPPRGVHGGWVAALFDDLLGATQGLIDTAGVTAILEVRYRQLTPLDKELRFEGWIDHSRGRRLVARGTCHAEGLLTAEAKGVFVRVDFDELQRRKSSEVSG
jgi:acyl-coenzyme A thioesterase PaaI-like protein